MRGNPVCIKCETEESTLWTNAENLGAVCLDCLKDLKGIKSDSENQGDDEPSSATMRQTRSMKTTNAQPGNSTSSKVVKDSKGATSKQVKGKSRRVIFKKQPTKAPKAVATPVTSDYIFYKGMYYQKGDIVSLMDEDDRIYYAQLRGFLTDQYCDKSAAITWLLPTQESPSPEEYFDPATYVMGPEEDIPRSMDCMEFVMHAPSDYYKSKGTPYPLVYPMPEPGFLWTRLEPIRRLLINGTNNECEEEIHDLNDCDDDEDNDDDDTKIEMNGTS